MSIALNLLESDLGMLLDEIILKFNWTIVAVDHAATTQFTFLGNEELMKVSCMVFQEIKALSFHMPLEHSMNNFCPFPIPGLKFP